MTQRVSVEDFKNKYGGDLGNLQRKLAVEPKPQINAPEAAETVKKRYVYLEYQLQVMVAKYLCLKYPNVLFESSPMNLSLTAGQRKMFGAIQKSGFSPPDMKIYKRGQGFIGFALELKKESPYLKDGKTLKKSEHLDKQQLAINKMREDGWYADFYWDFSVIKADIDWYLGENK